MNRKQSPPADYLPELIPELREVKITYDIWWMLPMPKPGEYLVNIGNRTNKIGMVYQIATSRRIFRRVEQPQIRRYGLALIRTPDMRPHAAFDEVTNTVSVKGLPAHLSRWNLKSKRK